MTAKAIPPLSGFYFKCPEEVEQLFGVLSHAELKVFLAVLKAEQRDRNAGRLSMRQIAKRADVGKSKANLAAQRLVQIGLLEAEFTPYRTTVFKVKITWRNGLNCPPQSGQFDSAVSADDGDFLADCPLQSGHFQAEETGGSFQKVDSSVHPRVDTFDPNCPPQSGQHSSSTERENKALRLPPPPLPPPPTNERDAQQRVRSFLAHTRVKNVDRCLRKIGKALNGDLWMDYYEAMIEATTNPPILGEGHFVSVAKEVSLKVAAAIRSVDVYNLPIAPGKGICVECGGSGVLCVSPITPCESCEIGRAVAKQVERGIIPQFRTRPTPNGSTTIQ